ncbi:MAG TPA: hypothetical protein VGI82_06790, partial [Chitinophagaceae bacterium]
MKSQTYLVDSLRRHLLSERGDKLPDLFALCWQGESLPADSFLSYARKAKEISERKSDRLGILQSDFFIARRFNYEGKADSALTVAVSDMQRATGVNGSINIYHLLWWQKIVALTKLRRVEESLDECYHLLESGEKYNDIRIQLIALTNIGVNYNVLRNRKEAVNWFNKAYHLTKDTSVYKNFPLLLINLATCDFLDNKLDSSENLLNKAFEYASQNQSLRGEADCFTLKAQFYSVQGKPDSAEQMLRRAVSIQKKLGYIQFILVGLDALQSFYGTQRNYKKAIAYIREAEDYSSQFHEPLSLSFYQDLAGYYQQSGSYKEYAETMDILMQLKDSMYQKSRAEDLARFEAQYELSHKEAFISKQKLELLHKNLWIAGIIFIAILILTITYLLFRRNRQRHVIALKQAEESERKRIAADLHDNIGAYASAISAGIDEIEDKRLVTD